LSISIDITQLFCTAIIMYCKSPDKAVLEPSHILYLQVTQPMSNMFFVLCFLLFLLKHKTRFLFQIYVFTTMVHLCNGRNVQLIVSVCLSVCLFMLPVAVSQLFSDGVAICHALPVL